MKKSLASFFRRLGTAAGRFFRALPGRCRRAWKALDGLCRRAARAVYAGMCRVPVYRKYREYFNYALCGLLTSLVQFGVYYLVLYALQVHYVLADNIGFFFSVIVAYYTNKKYVYHDKAEGTWDQIYKFIMFVGSRLVGQLMETVLLIVFVEWVGVNEAVAKFPVVLIVIVINYLSGKLLVFTKQQAQAEQKAPPADVPKSEIPGTAKEIPAAETVEKTPDVLPEDPGSGQQTTDHR